MNRALLQKLICLVEANLGNENFGPEELAREACMSQSNLNRKLKSINNQTISQFIREVRLKKAKELLKNEDLTIAEISYHVGFGSPTYFNKCFHEYFGHAPGELRNHEPEKEEQPVQIILKKRKPVKILVGLVISLIVLLPLAYFLVNKYPVFKTADSYEKSIAILPFINDSPDPTNVYFINGVTEAIIDRLAQFSDLNVISRISSEQYRNNKTKSVRQIAKELKVEYVLEGSVQRIKDSVLVSVQLIEGRSDKHILSKRYEEPCSNIFRLYNEIALEVSTKIKTKVASEDKLISKKTASENIEIKRMLIQGNELLEITNLKNESTEELLNQAKINYKNVILIDPSNQEAFRQLGNVFLTMNNLDSALYYAQKALNLDDKDAKSLLLTGIIYCLKHDEHEMEKYINLALKNDPEDPWAYHWKGALFYYRGEFEKAISYLLEASKMMGEVNTDFSILEYRRLELITLRLFRTLFALGFFEEAIEISKKWLALSNPGYKWMKIIKPDLDRKELLRPDSIGYIYNMLWAGFVNQKFEQTYNYGIENSDNALGVPSYHSYMGINLLFMNKYDEASGYFKKEIELNKKRNLEWHDTDFLYGFTLIKKHKIKEGEKYLKSTINFYDSLVLHNPVLSTPEHFYVITDRYCSFPYFMLTASWAAEGNKDKAMYYMRLLKKNWLANDLQVVTFLKYFPMFENIRNEPEFQQYLKEAETHYNTEHAKVEKLLREEGIIK